MFKRILVPVDGGKASTAGLRTALALARERKARLRLVHLAQIVAAPPMADGYPVAQLYDAIRQTGERLLARSVRLCAQQGIKCETKMYVAIAERASDVILEDARKWRPDLIVMGTHGRRGLRRFALGSDAEQVVRAATVPVLLVRAGR